MALTSDPDHPIAQARLNRELRELGSDLSTTGLPSFKKGGKVKRTGPAKLHKGERVIKASAAKKMTRKPAARRSGARGRKR